MAFGASQPRHVQGAAAAKALNHDATVQWLWQFRVEMHDGDGSRDVTCPTYLTECRQRMGRCDRRRYDRKWYDRKWYDRRRYDRRWCPAGAMCCGAPICPATH